jgi:hypothetical protein
MIILREKKPQATPLKVVYREGLLSFREADNLPAIAKTSGVSTNPKITRVVRQDTIFSTVQAMGIKVKINAMKNVVAEDILDQQTAVTVASVIYQQFGVKCSFMVTYEGIWKCYWSPDAPVDRAAALAYANAAGIPPPNPRRYLV